MERLSISNLANRIQEKENQLEYYLNKKERALLKVLPKSVQITNMKVDSSLDVSSDKMLEYVAELQELEIIIDELNEEIFELQKFEEKELKRLAKYDVVEQQVIHYREMGTTWSKIEILIEQRKIGCSLRTAKRIWKKYKGQRDIYDER